MQKALHKVLEDLGMARGRIPRYVVWSCLESKIVPENSYRGMQRNKASGELLEHKR